MGEFDLIKRYFDRPELRAGQVMSIGIGDDCAMLDIPQGCQLAVSSDTLLAGGHFFSDMPAHQIAQRCLAASVSDLAAMGATPAWFNLCLTLPDADPDWLADFSQGLACQAQACGISLAGGDTTKGPLSISIHVMGWTPTGAALTRNGAKIGDAILVSGSLGDSAAGLRLIQTNRQAQGYLAERYWQPTPRLSLGQWLRQKATACVDISDGLVQDLGHILKASDCGADLQLNQLPLSPALLSQVSKAQAQDYALSGGEDFELCFTLPQTHVASALAYAQDSAVPITKIGTIGSELGCRIWHSDGAEYKPQSGYQHF
jgi:thiamine-monophosphate kinase